MTMNYIIPQALAQAILDYLAAHPYREVAVMVGALQQLQPAPEPKPEPEPEPEL